MLLLFLHGMCPSPDRAPWPVHNVVCEEMIWVIKRGGIADKVIPWGNVVALKFILRLAVLPP